MDFVSSTCSKTGKLQNLTQVKTQTLFQVVTILYCNLLLMGPIRPTGILENIQITQIFKNVDLTIIYQCLLPENLILLIL